MDPVKEAVKKSLPKKVLEGIKKGDYKPFIKLVNKMVSDDEIRFEPERCRVSLIKTFV